MNEEEYFICHWPRCVLWWCSVTKIGYEVKKMISLQDFPFSCNKFLFGWGKKKKLCKLKKVEEILILLCRTILWSTHDLCCISVKGWWKWICWILIFFFIIYCLIQNAMCIPYKNILTRFHFSIFFFIIYWYFI